MICDVPIMTAEASVDSCGTGDHVCVELLFELRYQPA